MGEVFSLLAALSWALALVLFKRSGDRVEPIALNLFKNTVALILLTVTLVVTGQVGFLFEASRLDLAILAVSGVIGIAVADTLLFYSLRMIGVGLLSIAECAYSPFVMLCSWWMLAESPTAFHLCGAALVLGGVFVSTKHAAPAGREKSSVLFGMLLGSGSVALMAVGIVFAKLVLDGDDFPVLGATTVRLVAGHAALMLMATASPKRRSYWSVFRPQAIWRLSIPASILGSYVAMILWIAGFKFATATTAGILNQSSVLFALIFASIFLRESFTRRKLAAVALASTGVIVVTLGDVLTRAVGGWLG